MKKINIFILTIIILLSYNIIYSQSPDPQPKQSSINKQIDDLNKKFEKQAY